MQPFAKLSSWIFGLLLLGLSLFVALETFMRKMFSFSFEGADELGGYVLAVTSGLAFTVALIDRAHIRIDVIHQYMSPAVRRALDWLSILSLAGLGIFLLYVGRIALVDTLAYGSTAPTPWATPLIYPQSLWYAALGFFALVALCLAARATWLLVTGRHDRLETEFRPRGTSEEIAEEVGQLKRRPTATIGTPGV